MTRPQDLHDPGGKVKTKLPAGIRGSAVFSECGKYRSSLTRDWTPEGQAPRTIMFCGMNPSQADDQVSDPTVTREMNFSKSWGYTRYIKVNVLDWRATNPSDLPPDPREACSRENLTAITRHADESEEIVLAFGRMKKIYHPIIDEIVAICRASGKPLVCLGKNADGSAKHPLYLAKTTLRIPF